MQSSYSEFHKRIEDKKKSTVIKMKISIISILVIALAGVASALPTWNAPVVQRHERNLPAAIIPGNSIAEQVFVGGTVNFLTIYSYVVNARILLSWFPAAQGVAALQPLFTLTNPFLNAFRGIIPPIGGLDLSIIPAFIALNVVTNSIAGLGAEMPSQLHDQAAPKMSPQEYFKSLGIKHFDN
mmetsp:Transcript_18249/g.26555  ORF Transcript_18249/g.26555 Transcript_18249/m.26555 type:complete len:183 (-) Transcript_18249:46-594(-)